MPRVHFKTKIKLGAERSCGLCGKAIEPGDKYYTWKFRYGGARYRCADHRPRQSDLTLSKMSAVYAAIENAEGALPDCTSIPDVVEQVGLVAEVVREVAQEYSEAAEPFGGQGENQERADELEYWADELESFDSSVDNSGESATEEELETSREEALEALGGCPL